MDQKYDSASIKWLMRYEITMRVIQCIENEGNFYTSLRFNGMQSEDTYNYYVFFVDGFFKLYHEVGLFTTNVKLLSDLEELFSVPDITLNNENANRFTNLFTEFIAQLKKDGIYDPIISYYFKNQESSWEKGV